MQELYAKVCEKYAHLPWPEIGTLGVITNVCGGMGDIVACAKVIMILLDEIPSIKEVNWVVLSKKVDPRSFILPRYHSRITLGDETESTEIDFLLDGPAITGWNTRYMQKFFRPKLPQRSWHFKECGYSYPKLTSLEEYAKYAKKMNNFALPMGLIEGSGVLINAPLPLGDEAPSWWNMVPKEYSFNFGYAHNPWMKYRFVDAVSMHERERNICIVFTSKGEFKSTNASDFITNLAELDDVGELTVIQKAEHGFDVQSKTISESGSRHLLILLFDRFTHDEMIFLFRHSDRCLVTGNNSAIECWRLLQGDNSLFMYEDVHNGGVTHHFLDQQVQIADETLSKFLRSSDEKEIDRDATRNLLQNRNISQSTRDFCDTVKKNYDFTPHILTSLKRHFYLHDDTLRNEYDFLRQ